MEFNPNEHEIQAREVEIMSNNQKLSDAAIASGDPDLIAAIAAVVRQHHAMPAAVRQAAIEDLRQDSWLCESYDDRMEAA